MSRPRRHAVRVLCPSGDVSPWQAADIGGPAFPGSARFESAGTLETLEICAGGSDIRGRADEHLFVYQEVSGNLRLTMKVEDVHAMAPQAKVGVMIRGSLEEGAALGGSFLESPATAVRWRLRYRAAAGEFARASGTVRGDLAAGWLRVERRGATVAAFRSEDGMSWLELGEREVDLPEAVLAGVAAVGGDVDPESAFLPLTARVSNVELSSVLEPLFVRGDCNDDGRIDISDAVSVLAFLFLAGGEPGCEDACDSNDNGVADLSDVIHTFSVLFRGEGTIPLPGAGGCGEDPTGGDEAGCERYESCP